MDVKAVKDALAELGMSQNELARRCGVSPAHMSNILSGKRDPRAKLLRSICETVGKRPEEIW